MSFSNFRKFRYLLFVALVLGVFYVLEHRTASKNIIAINGEEVTIIDGDSFKSEDKEYRVYGIDAPEYRQMCKDANGADWPCGKRARTGLEQALAKSQYVCEVQSRDQYGRAIVICQNGTENLGAILVESGFALSGDHYDNVIYGREEMIAEKAKRGIWKGPFEKPANWRARHPR